MQQRVAFHIKAQFISRGLPAGFPSDAIVPHKLSPWEGSQSSPRMGHWCRAGRRQLQARLGQGSTLQGPGLRAPTVIWGPAQLRGPPTRAWG